jgi:3-oxoacyl-[acyl-carrier protein] reductase
MAIGLLNAGARVTLACMGPGAPLDKTLQWAEAVAPSSRWLCAFGDLRNPADCERIAQAATSTFGRIDVLVNNAAIPNNGDGEPFWKIDTNEWRRVARTNCDSVFFMSRSVIAGMLARRFGKIVNISTSDRTMARPRFVPYGPSKAFVEACTRAWSQELDGSGVTMNVLCPGGVVDTAADVTGIASTGKTFLPSTVMVAPLLWLAADESNHVNGQRFVASLWDDALDLDVTIVRARQCNGELPRIM